MTTTNTWYDSELKKHIANNNTAGIKTLVAFLLVHRLNPINGAGDSITLYARNYMSTPLFKSFVKAIVDGGYILQIACGSTGELNQIINYNATVLPKYKCKIVVTEIESYQTGGYDQMTAVMRAVKAAGFILGVYAGWYTTYFKTIQKYCDFILLHCYIENYTAHNITEYLKDRIKWIKQYNGELGKQTPVIPIASIEDYENDVVGPNVPRFGMQFLKQYGLLTLVNNLETATRSIYPFVHGVAIFKTKYGLQVLK